LQKLRSLLDKSTTGGTVKKDDLIEEDASYDVSGTRQEAAPADMAEAKEAAK
jgi:hypothetical protein